MSGSARAAGSSRTLAADASTALSPTDGLSRALGTVQLGRTGGSWAGDGIGEDARSEDADTPIIPLSRPLLNLPPELLIRIVSFDLGRLSRLSERIARETTLRRVCRVLADVVAAVEPSYRPDQRYGTLVLPDGEQAALDRLMRVKSRSSLVPGDVRALRRTAIRLFAPRKDTAAAVLYFLCEVVSLAKQLGDLEVDLIGQAAPAGLIVDIARHKQLRAVALLNGYCSPQQVIELIASSSLRTLHTDWATIERVDADGASSTWAIETQACSPSWFNELLVGAGPRFSQVTIDGECPTDFARLCPRVRVLHLKPATCRPQKIASRNLDTVRIWCGCGGWSHLAALLATDARSIELGWARGGGVWMTGNVSDLVGLIHDAMPQRRTSYWDATAACVAVRDVFRRAATIETVRCSHASGLTLSRSSACSPRFSTRSKRCSINALARSSCVEGPSFVQLTRHSCASCPSISASWSGHAGSRRWSIGAGRCWLASPRSSGNAKALRSVASSLGRAIRPTRTPQHPIASRASLRLHRPTVASSRRSRGFTASTSS